MSSIHFFNRYKLINLLPSTTNSILKTIKHLILFISIIFTSFWSFSQNDLRITPPKETYGVDHNHKLIVWNYKTPNDFDGLDSKKKFTIIFQDTLSLVLNAKDLSYSNTYHLIKDSLEYSVFITELPLIKIRTKNDIQDEPKIESDFSYANQDTIKTAVAGIELRGNISLGFPKKSYDLEFWEDPIEKSSKDMQFAHLRKDDDWILDGMYNEPLRLRSFLGNTTWLDMHQLSYKNHEKDASAGIDMIFTEVFLNNQYLGVYALTEQVDRKLLKLKKHRNNLVRGELFKANSYENATKFRSAPDFNNLFPHWGGFRMEYPVIDYKSHWDDIHAFINFTSTSDSLTFQNQIADRYDLQNAVDYFLFINLFRGTDNLGKNYYLARYNDSSPYFMIPWDLDGVLGTIQDGKRIPTTNDILSNYFFDRLLRDNPHDFRKKCKLRWKALRDLQLSDDSLHEKTQNSYAYFEKNKIYEREQIVWPSTLPYSDHLDYLKNWLTRRLEFMDKYVSKL